MQNIYLLTDISEQTKRGIYAHTPPTFRPGDEVNITPLSGKKLWTIPDFGDYHDYSFDSLESNIDMWTKIMESVTKRHALEELNTVVFVAEDLELLPIILEARRTFLNVVVMRNADGTRIPRKEIAKRCAIFCPILGQGYDGEPAFIRWCRI